MASGFHLITTNVMCMSKIYKIRYFPSARWCVLYTYIHGQGHWVHCTWTPVPEHYKLARVGGTWWWWKIAIILTWKQEKRGQRNMLRRCPELVLTSVNSYRFIYVCSGIGTVVCITVIGHMIVNWQNNTCWNVTNNTVHPGHLRFIHKCCYDHWPNIGANTMTTYNSTSQGIVQRCLRFLPHKYSYTVADHRTRLYVLSQLSRGSVDLKQIPRIPIQG